MMSQFPQVPVATVVRKFQTYKTSVKQFRKISSKVKFNRKRTDLNIMNMVSFNLVCQNSRRGKYWFIIRKYVCARVKFAVSKYSSGFWTQWWSEAVSSEHSDEVKQWVLNTVMKWSSEFWTQRWSEAWVLNTLTKWNGEFWTHWRSEAMSSEHSDEVKQWVLNTAMK
jgi:hypothetical protein